MANVKISALPAATSVASADVLPIVQSATTKKATIQNVSDALGVTTTVANSSSGLVFVSSTNIGTAVASVTVSNCFSSAYDSYRVVVRGWTSSVVGSTTNVMRCSMGSSSSLHFGSMFYDEWTGASTGYVRTGSGGSWAVCINSQQLGDCGFVIDFQNPFLAQNTTVFGNFYGYGWSGWFGGGHATASSYDGFKLTPSTGTISGGTITVYGYRKA